MNQKSFRRWIEKIRFRLRNKNVLLGAMGKTCISSEKGEIVVCCGKTPTNDFLSIFRIPTGRFSCTCGEKGDVFDFFMHFWGLKFGEVIPKLARATRSLTPGQKRKIFNNDSKRPGKRS